MQLIDLPTVWTVLLDFVAWGAIHLSLAYVATRLPLSAFDADGWLYRTRGWEQGGALYQKLFNVRYWKARLPSGGTLMGGFPMKRLVSHHRDYLERWLAETCRAELVHWVALFFSLLFFLWNPVVVGFGMIGYALAANMPCIIVQRYNRPQIARLVGRRTARAAEAGGR